MSRRFFVLATSVFPLTLAVPLSAQGTTFHGSAKPFSSSPNTTAVGDFNGDGHDDLVVGAFSNLQTFLATPAGLDNAIVSPSNVGGLSTHISVGDLDGDSKLDLLIPLGVNTTSSLAIVKGNGAGGFAPATVLGIPGGALDAVLGDLNHDGNLDIILAHGSLKTVSVRLGTGGGAFGTPVSFSTAPHNPTRLAIGDVDGDGNVDIAGYATTNSVATVLVLKGNGAGALGVVNPISVAGGVAMGIVAGDFNHDNFADIALNGSQVRVLFSNGPGGFAPPLNLTAGALSRIQAVDANGDGNLDIVGTEETPGHVIVLQGNGAGAFTLVSQPTIRRARDVGVLDTNLDGMLDLAVIHYLPDLLSVLEGNLSGGYGPQPPVALPAGGGDLDVGDFTGDAIPDVAVASAVGSKILLLAGIGGGRLTVLGEIASPSTPARVKLRDLNHDGRLDLLWTQPLTDQLLVSIATGGGAFAPPVARATGSYPHRLETADVNGDGNLDAVTLDAYGETLSTSLGLGNGSFAPAVTANPGGEVGSWLVLGDVTGDGKVDAIFNRTGAGLVVVPGDGLGGFVAAGSTVYSNDPYGLALVDLDKDGALDVVGGGLGYMLVYKGIVGGGLANPVTYTSPLHYASELLAGDVDGDGNVDIAAASGTWNQVVVFRGNGAGALGAPVVFDPGIASPSVSALADMSGDGRPDFVTSGWADSILRILRNEGLTPSGVSHYGTGTPGCSGTLTLNTSSRALVGSSQFAVVAANAPRSAPALFVMGNAADVAGSDPFGIGLVFHINVSGGPLTAFMALTDEAGMAHVNVPIPADPTLSGTQFFAQAFAAEDPATGLACSSNAALLVSSEGLAITIF